MGSQNMSQTSARGKFKVGGYSRRSWTLNEEHCLIDALKELVVKGLKCDNGFKAGYLNALEKAMVSAFPGTDLKGDPHINSKIHVWKKQYGSLSTMLSRSGFGWNDSTNMIDCSEQVWNEYVTTDVQARNMRCKSWPYYKDWVIIFGKDRATGESGVQHSNLGTEPSGSKYKAHELSPQGYVPLPTHDFSSPGPAYGPYPRHDFTQSFVDMDMGADFSPFAPHRYAQSYDNVAPGAGNTPSRRQQSAHNDEVDARNDETESVNISVNRGETSSCAVRNGRGRKRKHVEVQPPQMNANMVELMSSFFAGMESQIGQLVAKIGAESQACSKRERLFDALDNLSGLSVVDKLDVSKFLAKNPEYMDVFYGLTDETKATFVRQILEGLRPH